MRIVNYATYSCPDKIARLRPAHREYIAQLFAEGKLVAGGPFTDGSGALFIYATDSLAAAEEIVASDPYQVGGVFASYRLSPWEVVRVNPALISSAD